jgi:hypothetical protein
MYVSGQYFVSGRSGLNELGYILLFRLIFSFCKIVSSHVSQLSHLVQKLDFADSVLLDEPISAPSNIFHADFHVSNQLASLDI